MTDDARVAVVTGAAGGIGGAVCRLLADNSWAVVGIDRDSCELPAVEGMRVDITDGDAVRDGIAGIVARYGRIDGLVNAAGILRTGSVHDTELADWEQVFAVNVRGTFLLAKWCLPHLRAVPGSSIVNLASVHAEATVPRLAAYAASKGAVLSLTQQMALDYADDGVRVNAIVVGSVDTQMSAAHGAAMAAEGVTVAGGNGAIGRTAEPREIAEVVSFLLSPAASFVTGSALRADGGLLSRLM
ncbi:SDR family NAD(P)-dependent oxidoreductase [Nakamurella lactea]|uniref:SDR family NAD(P)-dependent oxidoreductase n=1 Tax=Nakamurella lactea TaxID=459515 RepID=UPI000404863B|nr:SDR family oxidoreductase [Nakamurella lactea]